MSTNTGGGLKQLLEQCKSLHSSDSNLTLQQLGPIHRTLLQCALGSTTTKRDVPSSMEESSSTTESSSITSLDSIVNLCCEFPEDQILCQQILNSSPSSSLSSSVYTDHERLLTIQYLQYSLDPTDGLRLVAIPYLLNTNGGGISQELESVMLESINVTVVDGVEEELSTPQWSATVESLLASTNPTSSRIIVRLLANAPNATFLIDAYYQKIWQLLRNSAVTTTDDFQKEPLIACLSRDMLPVLLTNPSQSSLDDHGRSIPTLWTKNYRSQTLNLWNQVLSLQKLYPNQRQDVIMAIITTVLCPLLPPLVDLTTNTNIDEDLLSEEENWIKPIDQSEVWTLIYQCLSLGKSIFDDIDQALASILRKRALYLLDNLASSSSDVWKKYVMCVELLEMENEQHLVDQIWHTVDELLEEASKRHQDEQDQNDDGEDGNDVNVVPGVLTMNWMSLLLSRVLSSDQLMVRKLGIYRILKVPEQTSKSKKDKKKQQQQQQKGRKKKTRNIEPLKNQRSDKPMLSYMTPKFICYIFIPSWNSLSKSVGYNMHLEDNRAVQREDMIPLLGSFLASYIASLHEEKSEEFWKMFWSWQVHERLLARTIVMLFQSLARILTVSSDDNQPNVVLYADNETLESLQNLFENLFNVSSIVSSYKKDFVRAMATILENCQQPPSSKKKWAPLTILKLLSFFSEDLFGLDDETWNVETDNLIGQLKRWTLAFGQDAAMIGSAVSAAFVSGQLGASPSSNDGDDEGWDLSIGNSNLESKLGWSIPLLCSVAACQSDKTTAAELLWPAISKGLSNSASAILAQDIVKAGTVVRAILLLENGCKLRQLSGLGNGDLVADQQTQTIMPPPANIEKMISSAVDFILYHIRTLLSMTTNNRGNDSTTTGSTLAIGTAKAFSRLISQLQTLHRSYPSSDRLSSAVAELLTTSCERLRDGTDEDDNKRMLLTSLIFAALSSGADPGPNEHVKVCRLLLETTLVGDLNCSKPWEQTCRTVFMYSRWGAISCLLPLLAESLEERSSSVEAKKLADTFFRDLLTKTFEAVGKTSISALPTLFECILLTGKYLSSQDGDEAEFAAIFSKLIDALVKIMGSTSGSYIRSDMLDAICKLAFQPKLLSEEYQRLQKNPKSPDPVRRAFRRLMKMAGTQRHHISRNVLCRITAAWLGEDQSDNSSLGLNAIPYRDDIVQLLFHKEEKIDETASSQSRDSKLSGVTEIPASTNSLSVSRAFILVFLSKLPDIANGLNDVVLTNLLQHVILGLINVTAPKQESNHVLIMKGTTEYVKKIRGWQALCILARFVTNDIVHEVCRKVFKAMAEPVHSQIRFFLEIFTIKCGTMHPGVFGPAFVEAVKKTDLTLPHVSSLMIIGGNWIVGKYKIPYFSNNAESGTVLHLRQVLAAIIPWLSSTQGFSRAIAQLLVYSLVPMVVSNLSDETAEDIAVTDSDWFIRSMYKFLNENREMRRLRNKQSKFFERYNVEEICTVEGIFGIPLDEGEEAAPENMIDAMKAALKTVYEEAHASDAPEWKQVEEILQSQQPDNSVDNTVGPEDAQKEVTFQRKIIPMDALNLAMEDVREKRRRNIAGNRKQQLIVCASLVDKVPNLGGLARTSEIFAADRLTIPDIGATKMDNFKTISVGAGDWIDIEEVKEKDLLPWLREYKKKGYFVFGLEQTSSSASIAEFKFPDRPTILLLGKEKEGIPVEFLQLVDQCVEIPQFGIIRSLNVHVSGAIAIWEYTKKRRLSPAESS